MKKILILGAALVVLSGCVSEPPPPPSPPPPPRPEAPPAPPADDPDDKCGAAAAQRFVGRPRTEIPVPVRPEKQRVLCTTCAATMDFHPDRLNFFYDAQTGVVKRASCG